MAQTNVLSSGLARSHSSHYVLNIRYLKREEAQSLHLLLPWDGERTQNRPRWQLLFKRPHKKWCQNQEISPSGENPPGCQENGETTCHPACIDFSEQAIQKASLAISRHTLSFTLGRHPSGHQNAVFSCKKQIMKAHKPEHPPCPESFVITHCLCFTQGPGQLSTAKGISGAPWHGVPPWASSRKRDSPAPLKKWPPLGSPKWHISILINY